MLGKRLIFIDVAAKARHMCNTDVVANPKHCGKWSIKVFSYKTNKRGQVIRDNLPFLTFKVKRKRERLLSFTPQSDWTGESKKYPAPEWESEVSSEQGECPSRGWSPDPLEEVSEDLPAWANISGAFSDGSDIDEEPKMREHPQGTALCHKASDERLVEVKRGFELNSLTDEEQQDADLQMAFNYVSNVIKSGERLTKGEFVIYGCLEHPRTLGKVRPTIRRSVGHLALAYHEGEIDWIGLLNEDFPLSWYDTS
jgi:hypothetical protein